MMKLLTQTYGAVRHPGRGGDRRRLLGVVALATVATLAIGFGSGLLTGQPSVGTRNFERGDFSMQRKTPGRAIGMAAYAAPTLSYPLRALQGAGEWLNTPPLSPDDLRGKVVLVNFWTFSCINSLRALPYTKAWAEKYRDRGLVVIGVHTPEFAFEKDLSNVRKALVALGVSYPVAIDSDYGIWNAFDNEAWPAFYFIGVDGRIRHQVLGERDYEDSERLIQRLLSERDGKPAGGGIAEVNGTGPEAAPDWTDLRSDETYVGYNKAENFASRGGLVGDVTQQYQPVAALALDRWSLAGQWTVGSEFATLDDPSGRIAYRFHARDLNLVMAPRDHPVRFRITIDGAAPGANHGYDVDAEGYGSLGDARMYQLVRQSGRVVDRTFEIEFLDNGIRAYSFTFG
jgi:thiol-disulfide isomerase/thioredoxin